MNKKLIASAIAAIGMMTSGMASAAIIGGVDFGSGGTHLETTTLAETLINGNNQELFGYGQINTVNGNMFYAGANRLYFVFDQYISNDYTPTSVDFSGGRVRVYLMPTFNLLNQSSAANWATITTTGTLWATLSGHQLFPTNATSPDTLRANGALTGATLSFTGAGLLDINQAGTLPDVYNFLNANTIGDGAGGFADIAITTSGSNVTLNPHDNTTGCRTGQATVGQWCIAGSADLRGHVVPEPGVLALVGLGLLGIGATRRKSAKS